ncbi:thioredoxin reductase 1, cytoplasmic-like isoform X2 [Melanotaenia boesemani]|uniref:thioredoxin reductase 1, cytoplasmic-like isoform X2 n=1 Tax=Melanotaenia boesemani TaxID=1250792 RepID=UPI001C049A4B|nr:thioredoxin reductase 1, cytoplasmic-like isoform X2 [Melanotaenia boesemani]
MDPTTGPLLGFYDYDLLVIGGGSGGLAAAKVAAGLRKKVLILDLMAPSARGIKRGLGGSSFNADSIRKYLQQTSLLGIAINDSQMYGWKFKEEVSHGWSDLVQAVQEQVKSSTVELKRELKSCGVIYLNAWGVIVGPHTVEVTETNGRKRCLTAETLLIATGDRPQYLGIPGDKEYCLTSEDLPSLHHPPGRTLVVGGSAEGLEWAGFLFGLGMSVTVMLQPDLLPGFDCKMAEKIENHMIVGGVNFLYHCSLTKVKQTEDVISAPPQHLSKGRLQVTVMYKDGQTKHEDFDTVCHLFFLFLQHYPHQDQQQPHIYICVAVVCRCCSLLEGKHAPATSVWSVSGCSAAKSMLHFSGCCSEPRFCAQQLLFNCCMFLCVRSTGRILVNERDQTNIDYIYAVGSVQHGHPATTGLSVHAGRLLARRLYGGESILCDYTNVPTVMLTPLEYAACGLTEEKANLTFGENSIEVYHSFYWPMEWTLPSRHKNSCYVKVICHIPEQERVVGLHIMGPNAGDVLQGFVTAMKCGLTKQQLDATVGIHPGSAQVLTSLNQTRRMTDALMLRGNC